MCNVCMQYHHYLFHVCSIGAFLGMIFNVCIQSVGLSKLNLTLISYLPNWQFILMYQISMLLCISKDQPYKTTPPKKHILNKPTILGWIDIWYNKLHNPKIIICEQNLQILKVFCFDKVNFLVYHVCHLDLKFYWCVLMYQYKCRRDNMKFNYMYKSNSIWN